jgi:hypothetical protein
MSAKRDLFTLQFDEGVREALDKLRAREQFPHPSRGAMINKLIKRAYCALECAEVISAMRRNEEWGVEE